MQAQMIIIATVGRSGSSFLAKWLSECGIDVGSDVWYEPFNAGMENAQTCSINQRLIRHYVKGEKMNMYYIWGDIHKLDLEVVKDPQFVAHPQILKNWHKVRKDLKVIFLHRKPEDIVESCKRLPEWTGPTYRLFPEMIVEKQEQFLKTLQRLDIDYVQYKYPFFLSEENQVINDISQWIDLPVGAKEKWRKLRR